MATAIESADLPTYASWAPTGFDTKGLGLNDRQDWLVGPVATNRDAGVLQRSNWEVVTGELAKVDPEGKEHEIHRFGHWANGWFEILLVKPGSKAHECAAEWACSLSEYPVASEEHFGNLEHEETIAVWAGMTSAERVRQLKDAGLSGRGWRAAFPPERVYDRIRDLLDC